MPGMTDNWIDGRTDAFFRVCDRSLDALWLDVCVVFNEDKAGMPCQSLISPSPEHLVCFAVREDASIPLSQTTEPRTCPTYCLNLGIELPR